MAARLEIGETQLADLKRVCSLGPDVVAAIGDRLENLQKPTLRPGQLIEIIQDTLNGNSEAAESVCRQSLALNGLMRQAGLSLDKIASGIDNAIEEFAEEEPQLSKDWKLCRDAFLRVVSTRAARLTAKAIDLSYDFANLFRRGRILTDVRPLFNQSNDDIEGVVISYTLRLRYDNVGGDHDLSLAMDQRDLDQLLLECQRAIKKGKTAKDKMGKLDLPAFITGEQNDGSDA